MLIACSSCAARAHVRAAIIISSSSRLLAILWWRWLLAALALPVLVLERRSLFNRHLGCWRRTNLMLIACNSCAACAHIRAAPLISSSSQLLAAHICCWRHVPLTLTLSCGETYRLQWSPACTCSVLLAAHPHILISLHVACNMRCAHYLISSRLLRHVTHGADS